MLIMRLGSIALGSLLLATLVVACSDDTTDRTEPGGGAAGRSAGTGGTNEGGRSASADAGDAAGWPGGASAPSAPSEGGASTGGRQPSTAGAGGEPPLGGGGQGGATETSAGGASADGETGDEAGGSGGETSASCEAARSALLGPIDAVSTGTVNASAAGAVVMMVVDASAGGFMAAANNPYIYLNLASKARVELTDAQADTSTAWDLALKRDSIRSNGGDSGPGAAAVAALSGAEFAAVAIAEAADAAFVQDHFIDRASCAPVLDEGGKPLTAFDGWYEYDASTMSLSPAHNVYLVRAADGATLYKLRITGYYVDVPNGTGGTSKKSGVYGLEYQSL